MYKNVVFCSYKEELWVRNGPKRTETGLKRAKNRAFGPKRPCSLGKFSSRFQIPLGQNFRQRRSCGFRWNHPPPPLLTNSEKWHLTGSIVMFDFFIHWLIICNSKGKRTKTLPLIESPRSSDLSFPSLSATPFIDWCKERKKDRRWVVRQQE